MNSDLFRDYRNLKLLAVVPCNNKLSINIIFTAGQQKFKIRRSALVILGVVANDVDHMISPGMNFEVAIG